MYSLVCLKVQDGKLYTLVVPVPEFTPVVLPKYKRAEEPHPHSHPMGHTPMPEY